MRYEELESFPCSITRPLVILGDRWTLLILRAALNGVRRFNAFQTELGISRSRLQDRLDRLMEHDILTKQKQEHGAYEEYRLTQKGLEILPILMAFREWGDRYMAPDGPPMYFNHRDCTGQAHTTLICDACGTPLTERDITPVPGPGMTARAS
ncbi:transcriptional regulator [Nocardia sp. SYP-A9097]|uniref:winged helix-turn-helix transcriptional regulator n=1 Tax=Nocardia sp. SYP-A9097 TaxID=2663237 RepID=UPI001329C5B7|nr:helix-turn-helix domain-containing protein [Nocardia sp. SYP-A9097]MRH88373.1 transcriptional regulator [Nocardia sp. SYP-A9097]